MLSPASRHAQQAALTVETLPAAVPATLSAHNTAGGGELQPHADTYSSQFWADLMQVQRLKSRKARCALKRTIIARYQGWLDAFIGGQLSGHRDKRMFVWLLVWHLDVADWRRGMELARHALGAGVESPKGFARNLAETITETMLTGILKDDPEKYRDELEQLAGMVKGQDMADPITAKLFKARGLSCLQTDKTQARTWFLLALEAYPAAGVKRYLSALDRADKPKATRATVGNLQDYELSAAAAARLANMSAPALIRHAKKYPDKLPHLCIPMGKRTVYRFSRKNVEAYLRGHLIKTA